MNIMNILPNEFDVLRVCDELGCKPHEAMSVILQMERNKILEKGFRSIVGNFEDIECVLHNAFFPSPENKLKDSVFNQIDDNFDLIQALNGINETLKQL